MAELLQELDEPGARACLVAPPGAGKTHCALHVAAALGLPAEVRVPTTALVEQWQRSVTLNVVRPDGRPVSAPVRVATYAGMGSFEPGSLVVLDEAHHLGGTWGRQIEERLDASHRILGLTATPPAEGPGFDHFLGLVGSHPVEVQTPPLVRDGHLCPYQDLVWPVLTEPEDVPALRLAAEALDGAEGALGEELQRWIARRLQEDLWELTEDRFAGRSGLLVALCRARRAQGLSLPADLPDDPEFDARPSLQDRARVLWDFGRERSEVRGAVRAAGFRPAGRGLARHDDLAARSLAGSRARLAGLHELLVLEEATRADWMRALVLVDRDVEGSRLSAREVLKSLVHDPRTDRLDPILVTGKTFWVDDDLWPRISPRLPELPWQRVGDHFEVDVSGWDVSDRVSAATRLLTDGATRCLVGTHHLLGEGWDCPALNCVVDLTGIVTSVTVNQVRGRGLRTDPADPSKVASLWEVVAVAPGVPGGGRMLERLGERHEHTLGIDPEGRIRAGVERIDPALAGSAERVAAELEELTARMAARIEDGAQIGALWAVGQDYSDRRLWRIEGTSAHRVARPAAATKPKKPLPPERGAWLAIRASRRRRTGWAAAAGGASSLLALLGAGAAQEAGLLAGVVGGPALLAGAVGLTGLVTAGAWALKAWQDRRDEPEAHAVLRALHEALVCTRLIEGDLVLEEGRAALRGPADSSRAFAEAAAELLGRIRYPRYLVLTAEQEVWPVPAILGADRDLADVFAAAWARNVGSCEVVFARQGRGRDLLVQAWRAPGAADLEVVEAWE
jgi:superfamily II DNA or RNA helicase